MSFRSPQDLPKGQQAAAFVAPMNLVMQPSQTQEPVKPSRRTALGNQLHRLHNFLVDEIGIPVLTNKRLPSGRFNGLDDKQTDQFLKAFSSALRDAAKHKSVAGFREKMAIAQQTAPDSAATKLAEAQYRTAFDLIVRQRLHAALQPAGTDLATGRKFVAETKEALTIYHASQDARRPITPPPAQPVAKVAAAPAPAQPGMLQSFMTAGRAMVRRNVDRVLHKTAEALVNLSTKVEALRPAPVAGLTPQTALAR